MKREDDKSDCPVNFSVETFGDTWSLLIVRDMAAVGKRTFNDFLNSEERIGPSVLAERLAHLEKKGIIAKKADTIDKRRIIYSLTERGLNVLPIVYEMARWGSTTNAGAKGFDPWQKPLQHDRNKVLDLWRDAVLSGSSFFSGPNSVVHKLGISDEY